MVMSGKTALGVFGDFLLRHNRVSADGEVASVNGSFSMMCKETDPTYVGAADALRGKLSKVLKKDGRSVGFIQRSAGPMDFAYLPAQRQQAAAPAKTKQTKEQRDAKVTETADAFFSFLIESHSRLVGTNSIAKFRDDLAEWKEREDEAGRIWRGGHVPVRMKLEARNLVARKGDRLVWAKAAKSQAPQSTAKANDKRADKQELQQLSEDILRERALVEKDKGSVAVSPLALYNVTRAPNATITAKFTVTNLGTLARKVTQIIVDAGKKSPYKATFEVTPPTPLPIALAPGQTVSITVKCKMPKHAGNTKGLLSVCFVGFAIGRFLDVTCGNTEILDGLKATSEYKAKKRGGKRQRGRYEPPPSDGRAPMKPFPKKLDQFKPPESWLECVRLGEAGERLRSKELAPLSDRTYVPRFQRLLWCEEDAQKESLDSYSMEQVTMRATSRTRLELIVDGLAENRPSVLRGDVVEVTCKAGSFQGRVESLERDRVLLAFHQRLHSAHSAGTLYDVHFVYKRVPMRLAHQGLSRVPLLRKSVLFPTLVDVRSSPNPVRVTLFNKQLNPEQLRAVQYVTGGAGSCAPYLLYGPPGTGKTTTLVEMVAQAVKAGRKVLAMAPTNAAADVVCARLHDLPGSPCGTSLAKDGKMMRFMAYTRSQDDLAAEVACHASRDPSAAAAKKARVVIGTLATASKLYNIFGDVTFDVLFIDEAGQALEPECVAPITTLMKPNGQVVLAGDHQQLGPIVLSGIARTNGLDISLLESLSLHGPYKRDEVHADVTLGYNPKAITMLTKNYRSHPLIIEVPNRLFYHSALTAVGDKRRTHSLADWGVLPRQGVPLIFHHLVGNNMREASSPSWFNPAEASQVLSYVQNLLRRPDVRPSDIGVIAPYHKQVQKLKKALTKANIEVGETAVKVGSTEMFQGQERRIIIISTVRSDSSFLPMDHKHNLGFVANAKRFNVAVTRAQALLIVVGNANVLASDKNWLELLKHCKQHGAWAGEEVRLPGEQPDSTTELEEAVMHLSAYFERFGLYFAQVEADLHDQPDYLFYD